MQFLSTLQNFAKYIGEKQTDIVFKMMLIRKRKNIQKASNVCTNNIFDITENNVFRFYYNGPLFTNFSVIRFFNVPITYAFISTGSLLPFFPLFLKFRGDISN